MIGKGDSLTVLDTTVLSNFAHVDHVELLCDPPRVATVNAVKAELIEGTETHHYLERAVKVLGGNVPVVPLSEPAAHLEREFLEPLDPGEAQALTLAEVTDGVVVTDGGDARSIAAQRRVDVTGSIGLLVRFVETGDITEQTADNYLKRWIDEAGFRSPSRDFAVFLR